MLDSEEKTGLSFQLLASSVDHPALALIGSSVRDAVGFTQLSVSRQLIFTVLNAKYVHPRPALLTDPFYKCNVITNVKNSCREITTTYLSAGHIESEAAGWKSGRLHCSLPRSDKSSSRSRLCWLRNNYYFPFASLRGNMTKCPIHSRWAEKWQLWNLLPQPLCHHSCANLPKLSTAVLIAQKVAKLC